MYQVIAKIAAKGIMEKFKKEGLRKIMSSQFRAKAISSTKRGKSKPIINSLEKDGFKKQSKELSKAVAKAFRDRLIKNIEENTYNFTLSESTIKRKGGDLPFVETGELKRSIYAKGSRVSIYNKSRKHPKSKGLTNLQLFYILEYGCKDKGIPSRPIWRNTYRDFDREKKRIVKEFNRNIRRQIGSIKFVF